MSEDAPASQPGSVDPSLPRVLASKYRLVRRLGEGGMGVVYAGDHLELKTRVAIKMLQPKLAEDAAARARFLREARLAASIESDHSARIFDVGSDGGQPYMVMEFLTGEPLDARLSREGRVRSPEAVTMMLQLLDALAEAHAKGLVHRDVKPANLFLVEKPGEPVWVKVLDFGISKVVAGVDITSTSSVKLTEPRTLLGSPQYMSPEQLRDSADVDARADVWACGVLLYELLTGAMPFEGPSLADLCAQIVSRDPRPMPPEAEVPGGLSRVVDRCLRKEPRERPQSALELATMLAPFAGDTARSMMPRIRAWSPADGAPPEAGSQRRHRLAGGLALMAVSGAVAFGLATLRAPAPATSSAPPAPSRPTEPLDPIAPPAPVLLPAASGSAAPRTMPAPSTSLSAGPPRAKPAADAPKKGRIQDLDGIELLH